MTPPPPPEDPAVPRRRRMRWIGHATVLLELGDARLLTDPALLARLAHLHRHTALPPDPGRLDAVLISHVHHDHLDRRSLRAIARPGTQIVVPAGAGPLVEDLGFGPVVEVSAGDTITVAGVEIAVVPAWHEARRYPWSAPLPAVGFLADGVWFAGDTERNAAMGDLDGSVDVALVPVWGWGPSLGPGHMDPEEAARAVALVRPRVAVPIHWGTFLPFGLARRHGELLRTPPHTFARAVGEHCPQVDVRVLAPGEALEL